MTQLRAGRASIALGATAGILLILIIGAYLFFVHPHTSRVMQMFFSELRSGSLPEDLSDATYVLASGNGGTTHPHGSLSLLSPYGKDVVVTDLVKTDEHRAAIGVNKKTGAFEVFLNESLIASSETEKRHIALSPSGISVLFSEKREYGWEVVRIDSSGTVRDMGPGLAGLFLDELTTVLISEEGVEAFDWSVGESVGASALEPISETMFIAQARDRTLFALRDATSKFLVVYKVTGTMPFSVEQLDFFKVESGHIALTEEAVYVTNTSDQGSKTIRHAFDRTQEPQTVLTLPSIVAISKLVP